MDRRIHQTLLTLAEDDLTTERLMTRLSEVRATISRGMGSLAKITPKQFKNNSEYWAAVVHGWADKIRILNAELKMIETGLLNHLTRD